MLAYARYNKQIGYCQGFNIIAAFILEIVDKKEDDALLIMIFLFDSIIPNGYYTNSMHILAIDMVVFRELLRQKLPKLYHHLNILQNAATSDNNYEPPLTNVFTMQWFLTLFATCLPKQLIIRIWDFLLLDGIEILFRTALAIWEKLSNFIIKIENADKFYTLMSSMTIQLLNDNLINEIELTEKIYSYGPVPLSGFNELREKYTFNIKPFQLSLQQSNKSSNQVKSKGNLNSNNNNNNLEDIDKMISCFTLLMPNVNKTRPQIMFNSASGVSASQSKTSSCSEPITSCSATLSSLDISSLTPGAFSFVPQMHNPKPIDENCCMDINELKKQYSKLKQRQQQAQVIVQTASDMHRLKTSTKNDTKTQQAQAYIMHSPLLLDTNQIYNHLLIKPENKNKKENSSDHESNDDTLENAVFESDNEKSLNELTPIEMKNLKKEKSKSDPSPTPQKLKNNKKIVNLINPFPKRPINSMVAKNGIRLGLYK